MSDDLEHRLEAANNQICRLVDGALRRKEIHAAEVDALERVIDTLIAALAPPKVGF